MKKLIDNKGRLFGVISVIDIVVILAILILAIAFYMKFFVLESTSSVTNPDQPITYEVTVNAVRDYTVNGLKEGDTLYDGDGTMAAIGTIRDIRVSDAVVVTEKMDGTYVEASKEGYYDVVFTVDAQGSVVDGRYYVNRNCQIGVNMKKNFSTKYCAVGGRITGIGA